MNRISMENYKAKGKQPARLTTRLCSTNTKTKANLSVCSCVTLCSDETDEPILRKFYMIDPNPNAVWVYKVRSIWLTITI